MKLKLVDPGQDRTPPRPGAGPQADPEQLIAQQRILEQRRAKRGIGRIDGSLKSMVWIGAILILGLIIWALVDTTASALMGLEGNLSRFRDQANSPDAGE